MRNILAKRNAFLAVLLCLGLIGTLSAGMGQILYEYWDNIGGGVLVSDLTSNPAYPDNPSGSQLLTSFDGPNGRADNYGCRISGYLVPPTTGDYTFWVAGDDEAQLFLSDSDDPAGLTMIASVPGWSSYQEWGKYPEQQSDPIHLNAGTVYYIEALMKEGGGGDHVEASWSGPDIAQEIIPGAVLSDTHPKKISNPNPADQAVDIFLDTVLTWDAPELLPDAGLDVYIGTTDPNQGGTMSKVVSNQAVTSYDPDLQYNTTYFWRVDVHDPNEGGTPVVIQGDVLRFTTVPETPVFTTQPADTRVWKGDTASFTVVTFSLSDVTYQWFKEGSSTVLGTDATLVLENVQPDDAGMYYCVATNDKGPNTSHSAELFVKQIVGHWPYDGNFDDVVGGNDGTPVGKELTFVEGVDGQGVQFEGIDGENAQAVYMSSSAIEGNSPFTLSFWEKTTSDIRAGYMFASGEDGGFERLYMWRREGEVYYGNLNLAQNGSNVGSMGQLPGNYPRHVWHLNTLTYDPVANVYKWYVDGIMRAQATPPQDPVEFHFDERFYVGNRRNLARAYEGIIDDIRLYNFPMDDVEVANLYVDIMGGYICMQNVQYDLNNDCTVNLEDFAILAGSWLQCNLVPASACN